MAEMEIFVLNLAVISSCVKELTMEVKVWSTQKHTLYTALILVGQYIQIE